MTKAEQIMELSHLPSREIAARLGCRLHYVRSIKSKMKKPEHYRQRQKEYDAKRRPPKGKLQFWKERDPTLIKMIKAGRLTREVADAVGATRNAVIGRWNRLKQAGLA
jgi:DNA invertase Pin-like site-specific DNA recombinase